MKINPINQTTNVTKAAFKGYTVHDSYGSTHLTAAFETGKRYEKTLDSYHTNRTGAIYYADPREKVSDEIKQSVDYVFYDDEPAFPTMEEAETIFKYPTGFQTIKDFGKKVGAFKDYFYRLEMVDRNYVGEYERKIWQNDNVEDSREKSDYYKNQIDEAQYNQETAGIVENKFNAAKEKIYYRNDIMNQKRILEDELEVTRNEIPKADKELKQRAQLGATLEARINNLKKQEKNYDDAEKNLTAGAAAILAGITATTAAAQYNNKNLKQYEKINELSKQKSVNDYKNVGKALEDDKAQLEKEKALLLNQKKSIQAKLDMYNKDLKANKNAIEKLQSYANSLPEKIKNLEAAIAEKHSIFVNMQNEIRPLFEDMRNYFVSRGIKMIH